MMPGVVNLLTPEPAAAPELSGSSVIYRLVGAVFSLRTGLLLVGSLIN